MQISRHQQFLGVLSEAGFVVAPSTRILDLGCGAGNLVMEFKQNGYDAYGCDLAFKAGPHVELLSTGQHIRLIDPGNYRLPFEDGAFDVVISDQVFEHVQDYETALREVCRILKPSGVSLHLFPPRYMPIEPHVFVPYATIVQSYWWLRLWAGLGVRNAAQRNMEARVVARDNLKYLTTSTNYLTKREIKEKFSQYFNNVSFAEQSFLKYSRNGQWVYRLSRILPSIAALYSALSNRVVVAVGPRLS